MLDWTIVVVSAWSLTALVLLCSTSLYKILRQRGLIAIERLMGMLLIAVSIEMFLSGLEPYIHRLSQS